MRRKDTFRRLREGRDAIARTGSAKKTIDTLRAEREKYNARISSYTHVRADLLLQGCCDLYEALAAPEQRVRQALAEVDMDIEDVRAACSHAWETIGEAKPPYEHCVRCYATRAKEPIADLIERSSIGAAMRDIEERGADAHAEDLAREMRRKR